MILLRPCNIGLPHLSEMAGLSAHAVPADLRCAARLAIRRPPSHALPADLPAPRGEARMPCQNETTAGIREAL